MAMKCCCISTNVGAVDEIINNGSNGIIISTGKSDKLVDSIIYLLKNKKERIRMAENGYQKIINNFDSKIMAKKTKKIYNQILK